VREVNRDGGTGRFKTSVLDVYINDEGKYLPHVYNVTFWDGESKAIVSSTTARQTWTKVGPFDLPATLMEVTSKPGDSQTLLIEFTDHELGAGK